MLFPDLPYERAANALSKALSMARSALAPFEIIGADREVIWLTGEIEVDADEQRSTLLRAMALPPGSERDASLVASLEERGRLLDDELYADWAIRARDELEGLRAGARITLARDRSAGHGRSSSLGLGGGVEPGVGGRAGERGGLFGFDAGDGRGRNARHGREDVSPHGRGASRARLGAVEGPTGCVLGRTARFGGSVAGRPAAPAPSVRTFGRDAALGALRDMVRDQQRELRGAILVSGPAGIGKTHLLEALGRELHAAGWLVVRAAAARDDRRAPLRALRSVLSQLDDSTAGPLVRLVARGTGRRARSTDRPPSVDCYWTS